MIVSFKVKFKRFVQGFQKFHIYPNSIKQRYDFNSCFLYSKKAKYLNSDLDKKSYDVSKIPRKVSLKKMRSYPGPSRQIAFQIFFKTHYEPNKFDFCQCNGLIMSQKKNEGILFSAEIRVVGSYTDRLLTAG